MSGFVQLGRVVLPQADAETDTRRRQETQLAERGLLSSGDVRVEQVSNDAADLRLSGRIRPPIPEDKAPMVAQELSELIGSDIGPLPLFDFEGEPRAESGYYEIADGDVEPLQADRREIFDYQLSLSRVGDRGGTFRAVRTTAQTVSHPFGSDPGVSVYIPDDVRKVRWYNRATEETQPATATGTVESHQGTLREYGLGAVGGEMSLLYDLELPTDTTAAYVFEAPNLSAPKFDPDGNRNWPIIYDPEHDLAAGALYILSGQQLRVALREPEDGFTPFIVAQRYDASQDEWQNVGIDNTIPWRPADVDLRSIDPQRLSAQVLFADGTGSDFAVNISVTLGANRATITPAAGESGSMPSGLVTKLTPIARTSQTVARPVRTTVSQREVRR
jgi:hypothetical protein